MLYALSGASGRLFAHFGEASRSGIADSASVPSSSMATAAQPLTLRADAERNRARIVAAARRVISRDGAEARMDTIAREAGVGVGTVYRRFPTKEELVASVLQEFAATTLEGISASARAADPRTAFEGSLHALAERLAENRGLLDALEPELRRSGPVLELRGRLLGALEPVLAGAQDAGGVRADVAVTDVLALASLVTRLPAPVRELEPRAWERFLAVVLDGLRPVATGSTLPGRPLPRELRS
jgi:AcrR family transcriptional regulator